MSGRAWDPDLLSGPALGGSTQSAIGGSSISRTGSGGTVRSGWTTDFSNAK